MHKAELIIKHATGLVCSKNGGQVTDEFPEFIDVYKKFHKFASWLMSPKSRSRKIIIEIPLPNLTRVGGCVILFHALLRIKFVLDLHLAHTSCPEDFKKLGAAATCGVV